MSAGTSFTIFVRGVMSMTLSLAFSVSLICLRRKPPPARRRLPLTAQTNAL